MKKLLSILAVAMLACTAIAQQYTPTTLYTRVNYNTYHLGPAAATNVAGAYVIPMTDYRYVDVFITANGSNHSSAVWQAYEETNALCAVFAKGVDGTYYDTNIVNQLWVYGGCSTNIGAPFLTGCKTFDVGAAGYLKLLFITNSMTESVFTNITIKYIRKPRQREY